MIDLDLTRAQKAWLRLLALGASAYVLARAVLPDVAFAQSPAAPPPPAAAAAPAMTGATRLFPDSKVVTRDRISVEVVGKGPDIVLIPGLASSRETWRHTAERLRGRYRLHLVNVAGFAGEPARANATGPVFDPTLEDIDGYIVSAGLKAPLVFGHSLGGTVGLALAERHPDHVGRVLIVDSLPFYGVLMGGPAATVASVTPMAEAMRARASGPMPEAMARGMMAQMVTAPADVDRVVGWTLHSDPAVVARAMTDDMLADLRPDLPKVTTPITVLYETPIKPMIEAGYTTLGPKTLIEVPAAKHFIMYDQPAAFDAQVDAFLKG